MNQGKRLPCSRVGGHLGRHLGCYVGLTCVTLHAQAEMAPGSGEVTPTSAPPQATSREVEIVVRTVRPQRDAAEFKLGAAQARTQAGTQGDPVKSLESMPGVARPSLASPAVLLWGAGPEDSRYFIDGVEIPQLFHGSAIRSTVPGEFIQSVTVTPGAYGPDTGRAIGGIVKLETRELPEGERHATLDMSTLDGGASASAEISPRLRVAIAGRYGLLDRWIAVATDPRFGDRFIIPRYHDVQTQIQLTLRDQETLQLVGLLSRDSFTQSDGSIDSAEPRRATNHSGFERLYARYRRRFSDGSTLEVVPWIGRDKSAYDTDFGLTQASLSQNALRYGLRAEHRSAVGAFTTLALGLDVTASNTDYTRLGSLMLPAREGDVTVYGRLPGADTNHDDWTSGLFGAAPYASVDVTLGPFTLSPSLRLDTYLLEASRATPRVGNTPSVGHSSLDGELHPRLAARLQMTDRVTWFAAAGTYSQPPAARDLSAVFGTPTLGPSSAVHLSAGQSVELAKVLLVTVTGFYRTLDDLVVRDGAPTPKLAGVLVQNGTGTSYGAQFLLRLRTWQGYSGYATCTVSRSERTDGPEARTRRFDYDEPYVLSLVAQKTLGKWSVGMRMRFASGAPRTPVVGAVYNESQSRFEPVFGAHNSIRLPDFWQLDARLTRRFNLGESAQLEAYLEALNLTNHSNAEDYVYSRDYGRRALIEGLPFLGVAGVRLEI